MQSGEQTHIINGGFLYETGSICWQEPMSSHHKNLVGSTLFQDLCSSYKAFHVINDVILSRNRNNIKTRSLQSLGQEWICRVLQLWPCTQMKNRIPVYFSCWWGQPRAWLICECYFPGLMTFLLVWRTNVVSWKQMSPCTCTRRLSSARSVFSWGRSCMLITYTAAWHSKYERLGTFFVCLEFFNTSGFFSLCPGFIHYLQTSDT